MRISRSLAFVALVTLAFFSANQQSPRSSGRRRNAPADEDQPEAKLDDAFVYDVVTRFNESLVGNIDAIDTAITAVLAGNVAIAVFAIDKIRELHHAEECWAIGLLSGSLLMCLLAYVIDFPLGGTAREGVLPSRFLPDVIVRQAAAVSSAIETVTQAAMTNLTVRLWKRALVVAAILLLLSGGVVVALARLGGNVIQ